MVRADSSGYACCVSAVYLRKCGLRRCTTRWLSTRTPKEPRFLRTSRRWSGAHAEALAVYSRLREDREGALLFLGLRVYGAWRGILSPRCGGDGPRPRGWAKRRGGVTRIGELGLIPPVFCAAFTGLLWGPSSQGFGVPLPLWRPSCWPMEPAPPCMFCCCSEGDAGGGVPCNCWHRGVLLPPVALAAGAPPVVAWCGLAVWRRDSRWGSTKSWNPRAPKAA